MADTVRFAENCRALWLAVLLQVKEDIETQPLNSMEYIEARDFILGAGAWIKARSLVADGMELDPLVLQRYGTKWLEDRRIAGGPEPAPPVSPAASKPVEYDLVRPDCIRFRPAPRRASPDSDEPVRVAKSRSAHQHVFNPSNPLLRRASTP